MKIHNITEKNIDKFFEIIENCEGKVELVCEDFRLNLKSRFAQYVSVAKIFFNKEVKEIENKEEIKEIETKEEIKEIEDNKENEVIDIEQKTTE